VQGDIDVVKIKIPPLILIPAIAAILLFSMHVISENMRLTAENSIYSDTPQGGKVFYLLLARTGSDVRALRKSLTSVRDENGVLIVISPSSPISDSECAHIADWVGRGGELLVADNGPNALYRHFGVIVYPGGRDRPREIPVTLALRGGGAKSVRITSGARLKQSGGDDAEHIIFDELGTVMARRSFGKGHVTVMSAPEIYTNSGILEGDNALAAVNAPCLSNRNRRLIIDEYHHGFSKGKSRIDIFSLPLKIFLLHLLVIALLYMISRSMRFGRPIPLPPPEKREAREFVQVMARLLQRAGARKGVLSILFREMRRAAASRFGLPSDADLQALSKCISDEKKLSFDDTHAFLQKCDKAIQEGIPDDKTLIAVARRLDELGKEGSYDIR